jgi:hypothetical protein
MSPKHLHHPWLSTRDLPSEKEHENSTDHRRGDKFHDRDDSPENVPLAVGVHVDILFSDKVGLQFK